MNTIQPGEARKKLFSVLEMCLVCVCVMFFLHPLNWSIIYCIVLYGTVLLYCIILYKVNRSKEYDDPSLAPLRIIMLTKYDGLRIETFSNRTQYTFRFDFMSRSRIGLRDFFKDRRYSRKITINNLSWRHYSSYRKITRWSVLHR